MIYENIIMDIKELILSNNLKTNERLPSLNQLCKQYKCSKASVQKAYEKLIQQGLVYSKERSGYFVAPKVESVETSIIDMETGNPYVEKLIQPQFYTTMNQALSLYNRETLDVGINGVKSLHHTLKRTLSKNGMIFDDTHLYITQGVMQVLALLSKMDFPNKGKKIIIEEPTYSYYIDFLLNEDMEVLTVKRNNEGIDLKHLEHLFATESIKFFYIQPHAHNPLGHDLSLKQKKKIVSLAKKYNVYLAEDAYFLHQKKSLFQISQGKNCIYLKSYTKTLPFIRIGFVLIPDALFYDFKSKQEWSYFYSYFIPSLASHAVLEAAIHNGFLDDHLTMIEKDLKQKKKLLLKHADQWHPQIALLSNYDSGYYFTVKLNKKIQAQMLIELLKQKHIVIRSNCNAFINPDFFDNSVRMTLARVHLKDLNDALIIFYQTAEKLFFLNSL